MPSNFIVSSKGFGHDLILWRRVNNSIAGRYDCFSRIKVNARRRAAILFCISVYWDVPAVNFSAARSHLCSSDAMAHSAPSISSCVKRSMLVFLFLRRLCRRGLL